ncbi:MULTISPECIES: sigma factor-like helix-turn-helix DNA-binding protein [unclassified Pseudomonas]|uniref:sigma factor-like helix-turn-helix DNA-binding protein n=1 Tax=unclassified Pseudomonas TaxID=196821 RepID=UPI0035C207A4
MTRLLLPLQHGPQAAHERVDDNLLHALKRLPRRVQQVFLLNRLDQLDFTQIAARLDLPLATVERHMQQALQATHPRTDSLAHLAVLWYARLQNPQVSACERIDFRRWLDASPTHLQAFCDTEMHWRSLLVPARELGHDGSYRQGRAALSLGGCSIALGLGVATLVVLGLFA